MRKSWAGAISQEVERSPDLAIKWSVSNLAPKWAPRQHSPRCREGFAREKRAVVIGWRKGSVCPLRGRARACRQVGQLCDCLRQVDMRLRGVLCAAVRFALTRCVLF